MTTPRVTTRSGFTMIELLVVSTILIVLTTIGLVSYQQVSKKSRDGRRKADMETLRQALVLYRTDVTAYPSSLNFSTMSPIQEYVSSVSMTDPKPSPHPQYSYTYDSSTRNFEVCATLEAETPAEYCLESP
jgi:prepilin-type N-terminal cleavage/methylation domain-containing protein